MMELLVDEVTRGDCLRLRQDSGLVDRLGQMPESSEERRIRYGELKQLRSMKRKFHETGGRRRKVLRPGRDDVDDDDDDAGGGDRGESREKEVDIRDVEFRIRNDASHVRVGSVVRVFFYTISPTSRRSRSCERNTRSRRKRRAAI